MSALACRRSRPRSSDAGDAGHGTSPDRLAGYHMLPNEDCRAAWLEHSGNLLAGLLKIRQMVQYCAAEYQLERFGRERQGPENSSCTSIGNPVSRPGCGWLLRPPTRWNRPQRPRHGILPWPGRNWRFPCRHPGPSPCRHSAGAARKYGLPFLAAPVAACSGLQRVVVVTGEDQLAPDRVASSSQPMVSSQLQPPLARSLPVTA